MSSNPFICNTSTSRVQGTVSQVEQSLSILQNALYMQPDGVNTASAGCLVL